ncbi:MAG: hypothetical protein AB8H79_09495 [Myxococcota bacterium]
MQLSVHILEHNREPLAEPPTRPVGRSLAHLAETLIRNGTRMPPTVAFGLGSQFLRRLAALPDSDARPLEIRLHTLELNSHGDVRFYEGGCQRHPERRQEYAAPECLMGSNYGVSAEVYATSATVLELISGRPLGRSPMLRVPHHQAVEDALAHARVFLPPLAAGAFLNIFRRGLAHDPSDRPRPREMAAMLDLLLVGLQGPTLTQFAADHLRPA